MSHDVAPSQSWLSKTFSYSGQKLRNIAQAIVPFLISQSDKLSDAWQRHAAKMAYVDFLKELLKEEIQTRETLRRSLYQRFLDASSEQKIQIQRDLEFCDGISRQTQIVLKSLSYNDSDSKTSETFTPIEDHWIDKFNELARARNEEWRGELLARALACEASNPGTVSPRALWLIGNMEEHLFLALSDLLNLCVWTLPENYPILPNSKINALDRIACNSNQTVGRLLFQLGDIGVIADPLTSELTWEVGDTLMIKYDQELHSITVEDRLVVRGVLFTPLGQSVARFFCPDWNPNGLSVLKDWIESFNSEADKVALLPHRSA